MTHVITRLCQDCVDADCVKVCPVYCILQHKPEGKETDLPNQLFIEPYDCIDCGLCIPECPWDAIYSEYDLPDIFKDDLALNAITSERRQEFTEPELDKKEKPTAQQIQENKERWGLVKKSVA